MDLESRADKIESFAVYVLKLFVVYLQCETPNWKKDTCCEGYVCVMPAVYDPIQKPRCTNKRFLPGFGYNFGYEMLGIDSSKSPPYK